MKRESIRREVQEQIRGDICEARGIQEAPLPVAPGRVLLATLHRATEVRIADIASVTSLQKPLLGLRGCVELHDGTRYFVPEAAPVVQSIRAYTVRIRAQQDEENE